MVNKGKIHVNALADTFIAETFSDAFPVALVADAFVKCGKIVLMIGDSVTWIMQIQKKGIILNGLKQSLKGRKENYTHEKEFIKEVKKSHWERVRRIEAKEFTGRANKDRGEVWTRRFVPRMMLEVAVEDELTVPTSSGEGTIMRGVLIKREAEAARSLGQ